MLSFLLPVVEYESVVWDGCSEQDSQTLQRIQNEAAHLVTGLTRSVSLERNVQSICGWKTLLQRGQQYKLSFMYNHTGQCKRTGGCYNELVVAFFSTGGGEKGKKIYTC